MHERIHEGDLKLDLLATKRGRARQRGNLSQRASQQSLGLQKRRTRQCSLSRLAPEDRRLLDQTRLGAVTRQQLRLAIGDIRELNFEGFGDTGVKLAPRFAQQGAVGGVLHERVLEEIGRIGGAPWRESSPDCRSRSSAEPSSLPGQARHGGKQGMGKLPPDRRAGLRHALAGPSRSSRAISEACRLAGTASAGEGTDAIVRAAAPALGLQHRLRHLLHEQRDAVGALDDILPDVVGKRPVAGDLLDQGDRPRAGRAD